MANPNIQIAIVDDDQLVVQLLAEFLKAQEGISVVLTANGGIEFMDRLSAQTQTLDIILLDLKMKEGDGLSTLEALKDRYPTIKPIVLSSYFRPSYTGYMFRMGACAFLAKETSKEELVEVIREVFEKGHYLTGEQVEALRRAITVKTPPSIHPADQLSKREAEVIQLICQQLTSQEIADRLFVSIKTIETHKSNIFLKTGVRNVAGLIMYSIQKGIVDPNETPWLD